MSRLRLIGLVYKNDRGLRRAMSFATIWTLSFFAVSVFSLALITPQAEGSRWAAMALVVAVGVWGIVPVECAFALARHRYLEKQAADRLIIEAISEFYARDIEIPDDADRPQE